MKSDITPLFPLSGIATSHPSKSLFRNVFIYQIIPSWKILSLCERMILKLKFSYGPIRLTNWSKKCSIYIKFMNPWILVIFEMRNTALRKPFLCYCKNLDCNFEFLLCMCSFFFNLDFDVIYKLKIQSFCIIFQHTGPGCRQLSKFAGVALNILREIFN